jgi:3-phosphoshikimate 1-carboxyvinyltransferase
MQQVKFNNDFINATIHLPASKSICNRVIILNSVLKQINHHFIPNIKNLADADDTTLITKGVSTLNNQTFNVKNAGTVLRFLTAYFAATPNHTVTLLCDDRMKERPLKPLTDALIQMGADIHFPEKQGFAPITIRGKKLNGGYISINVDKSSQFASALMLITPLLTKPLTLYLGSNIASLNYIKLTANILNQFGIETSINLPVINISNICKNILSTYTCESDWSSAAFWYLAAALCKNANIFLPGLNPQSLQGDAYLHSIAYLFGVKSVFKNNGIYLTNTAINIQPQTINLFSYPDLAPALICAAAALNLPYTFTGLSTLNYKESNRLDAIVNELQKLGAIFVVTTNSLTINNGISKYNNNNVVLNTYKDHRLAMAFALLAISLNTVQLNNLYVTEKSYPNFVAHLQNVGFTIN